MARCHECIANLSQKGDEPLGESNTDTGFVGSSEIGVFLGRRADRAACSGSQRGAVECATFVTTVIRESKSVHPDANGGSIPGLVVAVPDKWMSSRIDGERANSPQ